MELNDSELETLIVFYKTLCPLTISDIMVLSRQDECSVREGLNGLISRNVIDIDKTEKPYHYGLKEGRA